MRPGTSRVRALPATAARRWTSPARVREVTGEPTAAAAPPSSRCSACDWAGASDANRPRVLVPTARRKQCWIWTRWRSTRART